MTRSKNLKTAFQKDTHTSVPPHCWA